MEVLLRYILEGIVDHPEDIEITSSENEYGHISLEVRVNPEDMGKVIGKNGKIISAIRKILKVKAMKTGKRFNLELVDQQVRQD
ncbi:MAG: KH domain-containing protein [Patescibacteria group bacterium]|jgi:predicted RNA-binding protein YlqC (UPF0109 family)